MTNTLHGGKRHWLFRRAGTGFFGVQRVSLATFGLVCFCLGTISIFTPKSPQTGGIALLIAGTAFILLALIGRLPDKLSAGGWEIQFGKDTLRDILELVQAEAPEIFPDVVRIAEGGSSNVSAVREAVDSSRAAQEREDITDSKVLDALDGSDPSPRNNSLVTLEDFKRDQVIGVPSRGRPPRVDATFKVGNVRVALEIKANWSMTTADVVSRRLSRVLTSDDIDLAVLVVPSDLAQEARRAFDDRRVLVVDQNNIEELTTVIQNASEANKGIDG